MPAPEGRSEPEALEIGDHHYQAYVGPPDQYDIMGASQFLMARDPESLPSRAMRRQLGGAIVLDPTFRESWTHWGRLRRYLNRRLPPFLHRLRGAKA